MALPDSIVRADIEAAIREGYSGEFLNAANGSSAVLQAVPTKLLSNKVTKFSTRTERPTAGWVTDTDNTAVKPKSKIKWSYNTATAEEIAVIIPVHEDTIADADEDVLASITAEGGAALGRVLDATVLYDTNKPATWTSPGFLASATAASQLYTVNDAAGADDLYGAHLDAAGKAADKGIMVSRGIAAPSLRWNLANLRDADGRLLVGGQTLPFNMTYADNGEFDSDQAISFLLDPNHVRIGIRKQLEVKFSDQAFLTNGGDATNGFSLWERDMVALRFVMRVAYVQDTGLTSTGDPAAPIAAVVPAPAAA
jgi:HK97 family phage major capsid protein